MKKRNLRIAMLGHKRIPSREGGIEIVVEELSTRMVQMGHKVTCYNRTGHHIGGREFDGKYIKEYKGIRLNRVLTINKRGVAAMSSSIFAAIKCAFGRYDIVHFHAEGPCAMIWLPKLFGKRCIATIHGLDHQRAKWGKFARWYIMMGEKCAVKFADEIIVLSEGVQEYFFQRYGRDTKVIPNGVLRPNVIKPNIIKQKYGLEKNSYILFLARLVQEKGVHYLIEAFKSIKTDKKLVIAGASSDTDFYVKQLKELALYDKRIIFTGFVQGEELEELYSNSYIYVLPSDLEGMPLSLLEAMSYGNCCITSDISECVEVVEDKGIIFKKSSVEELREKIEYLCENENIVEAYKNISADYICDKYNWNDVTEQTLNLYEKQNKKI